MAAEKRVTNKMSGSDSVIAVLEMRDKGTLKGIHGTIAELGSVEPRFGNRAVDRRRRKDADDRRR